MQLEPLVEVLRGGLVESSHLVSFALVDPYGQLIASWGDPELVTFMRSSAKPFQAIPVVERGAADRFHFEARDLALICASHSGTETHVQAARSLLAKIGVAETALQCGVHVPYDDEAYKALLRARGSLEPVRNNCSGKHAGMLALAKHLGADLDSYLNPDHPVQRAILGVIAEMTGLPVEVIIVGVDGCSAPTFAVPLRSAARAYAQLVDHPNRSAPHAMATQQIFAAMTAHSQLVGGQERFDTQFMQAVDGRFLSKSGAEGFQCVGIPPDSLREGSPALGLSIKVHDGDDKDHRAAALTALELVGQLGGFKDGERERLASFDSRVLENLSGTIIGNVRTNPTLRHHFELNHEWE